MKSTQKLLQEAMAQARCHSYAEFAREIGVTRAALSHYGKGLRVMDDYTAAKIAEVLGLNPLTIIAQANAERENDPKKARYWSGLLGRVAQVFGVALLLAEVGRSASQYILC